MTHTPTKTPTSTFTNTPTATPTSTVTLTRTPVPFREYPVDNLDSGYQDGGPEDGWISGSLAGDKFGSNYRFNYAGTGKQTASWFVTLSDPGQYSVSVWYPSASNRPYNAPYTVYHSAGSTTFRVDQQRGAGQWQQLGIFSFDAGTFHVEISDDVQQQTVVMADAVKWCMLVPTPTPTTRPLGDTNGDGLVNANDVLLFANNWGQAVNETNYRCDIIEDEQIDDKDLLLLLNEW